MISKQKRLSGRDITKLFTGGKTTGTPFFVARYSKNPLEKARISVIVPKNVAKTAFLRNSTRRKWYTTIQKVQKSLVFQGGTYALVLKGTALNLEPVQREAIITSFFSK